MRGKIALLVGAALAVLASIWAVAQPLFPAVLTGSELVNVTLPNGSGATVTIGAVRGAVTPRVINATTGTSATTIADQNIILTGAVTALTLTLPNPAQNGEMMQISNSTAAAFTTALTVTTAAGNQTQSLNTTYNGQTLNAGASIEFVYVGAATGTWYRVQ